MRILFIGDIVGRTGRNILLDRMPKLIAEWKLDLVVVNGENAAGGFGITEAIYNDMIDAGADAITLGNHAWDQREALVFIERAPRLVRPVNYPKGTPGRGAALVDTKNGKRALVVNAMGRIFMDAMDDPFAAVDREISACALGKDADAVIVDMHCEATSEKQAMGFFCDGRASLVLRGPGGAVHTLVHQPRYVADDLLTLKFAALQGTGMCFLPDYMCRRELEAGRLVHVLPGWAPPRGSLRT